MDRKLGWWTTVVLALIAGGAVVWLWRQPTAARPIEVSVRRLPLAGGAERAQAEISGMAWWRDTLLLLPQYPARHGGVLFALERAEIEALLDGEHDGPLRARGVPLLTGGLEASIEGFDGFEAIAIAGDDAYLAIEGDRERNRHAGWVVRGRVQSAPLRVVVAAEPNAPLAPQNDLANTGYEALVLHGDQVLALYETNGEVNPAPRAIALDTELQPARDVPIAPIEYRVTDATAVDPAGRFWVSNYHWPGAPWAPGSCSLTERYGEGESHARCATVERLVELRLTDRGVVPTDRAPIWLELIDDRHARNWEGLVRLEGRGFLLITDEHPDTLLAFVPAAP